MDAYIPVGLLQRSLPLKGMEIRAVEYETTKCRSAMDERFCL